MVIRESLFLYYWCRLDLRRDVCRLWQFTAIRDINKTADTVREGLTAVNRPAKSIDRCLPGRPYNPLSKEIQICDA